MKKRAFTITELLVVILIIAIVASIAFPVFTQTKYKAQATTCISNIRQIYTAVSLYENEYGEYPPNRLNWPGLKPYYPTLLHCPAAPKSTSYLDDYNIFDSFVPNPNVAQEQAEYDAWDACKKIRGPAMPIIFDRNHEREQQAYVTGSAFFFLGRLDGSVARIDAKMANDVRLAHKLPCGSNVIFEMNF